MKRNIGISVCIITLLWGSLALTAGPRQNRAGLAKSTAPAGLDFQAWVDANDLLMFVTNVGSFAYDAGSMFGKADGLYFPRSSNQTVFYAAGLWLGAIVDSELRISVAEYDNTFVPGPMSAGQHQPDNNAFKVYKIYRELLNSGFYAGSRPIGDPSMEEKWDDYHNWPAVDGAPVDPTGNPLITGDQTLWSAFNDADDAHHSNYQATAEGLGVEIRQTTFAFDQPGDLGRTIFMHYELYNKSGLDFSGMYVGFWADPDLGGANDDFVGCDSVLGLVYCYNADNDDAVYGSNPPAVGFDLLSGPATLGLFPMTASMMYINGTDPNTPQESYWYLQGLDAKSGGVPIIDPTTTMPTTFMVSGDPILGTGWLDSNPSDRRFMCSSGPLNMLAGDSVEFWLAVIVAQGNDRLESVSLLKAASQNIQEFFDGGMVLCGCDRTLDINGDGVGATVGDLIYLIQYMFHGGPIPPTDPDCALPNRGDVNCDGVTNLVDIVKLINFFYRGFAPEFCDPCAP